MTPDLMEAGAARMRAAVEKAALNTESGGRSASMKRIAVPGTPLGSQGEISAAQLAKICAVTTLTARPPRAMCVHEPDELCLMAGANQIYAECGVNPRDNSLETRLNRGFSTEQARALLQKTEWEV